MLAGVTVTERQALVDAKRALAFSFESGTNLCDPFLSVVPVTGAAVSVLAIPSAQSTVCASDGMAAHLDELQFDLGEGPCWEALAARRPALHGDLQGEDAPLWPAFSAAVRDDEVGAMYAFPLVLGSLEIGAIDLYSTTSGRLTRGQVTDTVALTQVAAWQVLRRILADAETGEGGSASSRREIHQATGMVLAQLDIAAHDALLLLRAHAFSTGRSVREVANDVVERRLSFTPEPQSQDDTRE